MNQQTLEISPPPNPMAPPWGPNRSRRGFTLIELLVVIGIILILMGLFYAGLKIVTAQAKERDTKTMLETCKTMFENYRSATHLSRPPTAGSGGTMDINTSNASGRVNNANFWTLGQESAPAVLSTDANAYSTAINVAGMPEALINTALVMYSLKSVPENATILNNIPAGKTLNVSIALKVTGRGVGNLFTVPILLDGWGNPILFVPGGGMTGVWVNPAGTSPVGQYQTVTSNGIQSNTYDPASAALIAVPSGNQPFFVSAGPDSDFSNAHSNATYNASASMTDDNIYSFK
jgi:prepilin-type N-terminal cleavage/methylation domain-containing protein